MATLVRFVKDSTGEITAVFPQLNYNSYLYGNTMKDCYMHVGQHGCCSKEWLKDTVSATIVEYADLFHELVSIGYENLRICK